MVKTIKVSDEVYKHLTGLGVQYDDVAQQQSFLPTEQTILDYDPDPSDFIFLQGIQRGPEKRPDLLVGKYRLSAEPVVQEAGRKLGLRLENTAEEQNGREYAGNINREQAIRLNLLLGGRTADLRLAKDFLALLYSGEALDGNQKKVEKSELTQIANEITEPRAPWRSEWFEDCFTERDDRLTLEKHYALKGEVLVPQYSHKLTTCLIEDRIPGIDLQSWLNNSTAQGFPKKSVKSGELYSWHPRPNRTVRFGADPDYANLDCSRYPRNSYPWLGVRHVREAHAQK